MAKEKYTVVFEPQASGLGTAEWAEKSIKVEGKEKSLTYTEGTGLLTKEPVKATTACRNNSLRETGGRKAAIIAAPARAAPRVASFSQPNLVIIAASPGIKAKRNNSLYCPGKKCRNNNAREGPRNAPVVSMAR